MAVAVVWDDAQEGDELAGWVTGCLVDWFELSLS